MKKLEKPINNSILNILRKRSSKIKSYEVSSSKQPLKNQKDNNSPKKKNQSKDKDINSLITNIYHYFINDHTKLDELHVDLTEKIFNFQKDIDLPKKDGYYDQFDFLTDVEITEIKNNYKDFMLEDYLLIFPNPDQMKKDRAVTFKEALEVFDKALVGRSDETINKIQALKEKLAFIQAFQMLDDFVKEDGEDDEEDDEDLDEESPLKKKTKKKKSFFKSFFKRKREKKLAELKKISFFSRFFKKKNVSEETIQQDSEKKVFTKPISRALSIKLSEHENELLKKTSFTEEDLRELKMVFKKMQKMKIVKKFCKGQFLQKKAFVDKKDDGYDYVCKNTPAKDFLTLVRNVIITKLTMISKMHTRLFLSSTGKDILMVLKCDDNILKKQADLISMSKQMELGACDLLSLEPVDQLLRPFRLKNFVKMDENEYKESNQQGIKKKKWENNKKNKEETVDNLEALAGLFEESILNHENLLQESCREIYKRIQNINENQFRLLLVDKSCKINEHLRFLVKQYKIDMPDPNTEIQNDCLISRKEWAAYFIYLCYLEKYFDLLLSKLKKNQYIQENILFLLKLIFRKAVGDSNEIHDEFNKSNPLLVLLGIEKKKSILKTIWSKLRMDPSPPFSKFFISGSLKEKTKRNLWRTYEINEQNERSIFLNMEKMKLINDIILKNVNMVYLMKHLYIDSYFPLHNYYELNLKKTRNLFNSLVHSQLIVDKPPSEDFLKLNELFMDLADEAENTDFNSDGSCFEKETLFEIRRPWYISIETIRNYFGEKIAIYFSFLSFYTLEIGPMAFLGLFAQIFLYLDIQSDAIKLSFSILIIIWSTIFIEMWKRRQYMFAVKYGQLDFQEEEAERPDFKGNI